MKILKVIFHFLLILLLTIVTQAKQAQVFEMKTILNYETEAICNELNITASNLWVIIHRARTAMAGCLEKKLVLKNE
ncbi:hypothetical protein [Lacinutrix sp.]|uniref:hypothetical protein n=1 Tax=Lacinutrix sp. TaxID=1937692 RepID=UPI002623E4FE|nr:hypothetical protein [Lacinutrix sp.]MDG1715730.1 hypothetical protein [Lacinutrix sp.]